jgi:hypothetical protein
MDLLTKNREGDGTVGAWMDGDCRRTAAATRDGTCVPAPAGSRCLLARHVCAPSCLHATNEWSSLVHTSIRQAIPDGLRLIVSSEVRSFPDVCTTVSLLRVPSRRNVLNVVRTPSTLSPPAGGDPRRARKGRYNQSDESTHTVFNQQAIRERIHANVFTK